ncbi:MAG: LysM peptidoglycan-binding domain-containing protein [Bacteroidales bacterium]|nr:LysM peptidoglycan-binding domain-containing protein [Bacteroidales bacterium]
MKNAFYLILLFIILSFNNLFAIVEGAKPSLKDTIRDEAIVLPETLLPNLDSLLSNWLTTRYLNLDKNCIDQSVNPSFTDSIYIERLSKLSTVIEMPYNQIVRSYINLYAERLRVRVSYMMGLSQFYFPLFEQALDAENLPLELKYLPVIESALNPSAISHAGAAGLWQFMLPTGKQYGLEITSLIDERRDPIKSTYVAARYLKNLHRIYGDWGLAIAAYNCGPGNVNKAIRRSGGKRDYWEIYFNLPKETRGYLPAFIAVNYLMNYTSEHNICSAKCNIPLNTDTVVVNQMVHFQQIADVLNLPIQEIRTLNPSYKHDLIPGNISPCVLRLPMFSAYSYIENADSISKYRADDYLMAFRRTVEPTPGEMNAQSYLRYKVKRGETLATIARKYRVSVSDLKDWNKLYSSRVSKGKSLKIYRDKQPIIESRPSESLASRTKSKGVDTTTVAVDSSKIAVDEKQIAQKRTTKTTKYRYYIVERGDTLWAIANRFPGISVKDIMAANRLRHHNAIQVGMKIKIPKT